MLEFCFFQGRAMTEHTGERPAATWVDMAVDSRGARLPVRRDGAGPALVWSHCLMSSMAQEDQRGWPGWHAIRQHVALDVVRYDARGHGAVDPAGAAEADPGLFDWPELARDMLAVADGAGLASLIAAGTSMGAMTALCAALQAPQRVRALILVGPPLLWDARAGHAATLTRAAALMARRARHSAGAARLVPLYLGAARANLPPRAALESVARIPTLIVAWQGDPEHPLASAQELMGLLPNAELVCLEAEEGGAIDAAIVRFLARELQFKKG